MSIDYLMLRVKDNHLVVEGFKIDCSTPQNSTNYLSFFGFLSCCE